MGKYTYLLLHFYFLFFCDFKVSFKYTYISQLSSYDTYCRFIININMFNMNILSTSDCINVGTELLVTLPRYETRVALLVPPPN